MASTFTPNIQLEEPARGDQVGTWDTPVNNNMTLTDLVVGGIATISLNNSPVVLAAAQFQARQITFNSTLTGSCAITFPSTFTKSYDIQNLCSGSSAFIITLGTTVAGGQVIALPFGETIECFNDGANIKFRNLDRIGSYWDYAGSSVPAWVTGCTVPPYLNCDATTFSSATYPVLATILGSTTLPDSRGRVRAALDQGGTARLSAVITSTTVKSAGGSQNVTVLQGNLPALNLISNAQSVIVIATIAAQAGAGPGNVLTGLTNTGGGGTTNVPYAVGGQVTPLGGSGTALTTTQPTYMGGITMIRSA